MTRTALRESIADALATDCDTNWESVLEDTNPGHYGVQDIEFSVASADVSVDSQTSFTFRNGDLSFTARLGGSSDDSGFDYSANLAVSGTGTFDASDENVKITGISVTSDLDLFPASAETMEEVEKEVEQTDAEYTEPIVQRGIVCFFDILGYTSFLENNPPEDAAKAVLRILANLKDNVLRNPIANLSAPKKAPVVRITGGQHWLVFSDSIVFAQPYPANASDEDFRLQNVCAVMSCRRLARYMFDNGLPVRGAMMFGDFLVKGTCFAGQCIIDAYKLSNRVDLAGVLVGESALKHFNETKSTPQWRDKNMVHYLVPMRDRSTAKHFVLVPAWKKKPFQTDDLRQLATNSFLSYKKEIAPSVIPKLTNTELFFRFLKFKQPDSFAPSQELDARFGGVFQTLSSAKEVTDDEDVIGDA